MTKLTTKQKEIVDSLTKGFIELNSQNTNESFSAININALRNDVDAVVTAKKELELYNNAMKTAHNLMIEDFCEKMNADFKKANFPIVAKAIHLSDGFQIEVEYESIRTAGSSDFYGDKVEMRTSRVTEEVKFGLTSIGSKILKFQYALEYSHNIKSENQYKSSPQLFFADEEVQKKMIRLIRISEEFKRTGVRPRN